MMCFACLGKQTLLAQVTQIDLYRANSIVDEQILIEHLHVQHIVRFRIVTKQSKSKIGEGISSNEVPTSRRFRATVGPWCYR